MTTLEQLALELGRLAPDLPLEVLPGAHAGAVTVRCRVDTACAVRVCVPLTMPAREIVDAVRSASPPRPLPPGPTGWRRGARGAR